MNFQISISKELYEKLKDQLKLLKDNNVQGLEDIETIEQLIVFYLEHFSAGEEKMKKIEERMQSVLDTLKDRGVDVMDLFDSFNKKIKEEEKEGESDDSEKNKDSSSDKKKS
ncbi:hypothetical protein OVS_01645 [Mycoplasma ovis str. Michigan]|uniref:Uncharacterized protein n=1 Tax=Mycoplasma ovis str. Michigan TaxID=1415773 RepID=A0ABM5P0J0_9MOLU|nr:hypothetical protein OVS_01645 [Mycoplasma ovis str. Michigan]